MRTRMTRTRSKTASAVPAAVRFSNWVGRTGHGIRRLGKQIGQGYAAGKKGAGVTMVTGKNGKKFRVLNRKGKPMSFDKWTDAAQGRGAPDVPEGLGGGSTLGQVKDWATSNPALAAGLGLAGVGGGGLGVGYLAGRRSRT